MLERFGAERFAVIDVGTNSVKFHLGDRRPDGSWRTVVDRAVVTRLGEGPRQTGRLGSEPMERTAEAIAGMAEEARRHRVGAIAAVGTAGLRIGCQQRRLRCRSGGALRSPDRRHLGRGGGSPRLPCRDRGPRPVPGSCVVFDTGGGSSQFSFGEGDRVEERFSVEVGAVAVHREFGLDGVMPRTARRGPCRDRRGPRAARRPSHSRCAARHGRSGHEPGCGPARPGGVRPRRRPRHGARPRRDRPPDRDLPDPRRRRAAVHRGLQPARAEVILAGAAIVRTVLDKLGVDSLTVSDRGLRYGVRAELFGLDE